MRVPVVVPVVLVVVLAACGASPTMQAGHDPVLKVGAIISQTGVYAALGDDMETAMRLYLDEHGGRLGGRPAALLVADDAGNPETGGQRARQLIDHDGASVITGLLSSPVALTVVRQAGGVPVVIANAGADGLGGPGVYRVSFTDHDQGFAAGKYAAEHYGTSGAVLMAPDYTAGTETLDGFEAGYGAKALKRILTPFDRTKDFAPYLAQIPADAKFVYAFYAGGEAITFARAFSAAKVPLLACQHLADEDVTQAVGPDADGMTSVGMYAPTLTNQDNTAFVALWRSRTGRNPSVVAVQGWDAMRMIDLAADKGGDLARALSQIHDIPSPRGPLHFDATHNPVQNWYVRQYQNGENRVLSTISPGSE
ncbi:ABC transporter substrate-binding protein [Nonomuraea sediminis]|uniref:ABC transporter substrate-binding protein n=1 Tax=Nonomuraea sediminis TaxID=2835864 RepID=UPI001BDCBB63|nr:ABC transporter substrate-binding protein [Nonomuraea sediminis]